MNITQCDLPYPDLSQRTQYSKGGISRKYWDYRDECVFNCLEIIWKGFIIELCRHGGEL